MAKFYYASVQDRELVKKSINNLLFLIFGKNNQSRIEHFKRILQANIKEVNIHPQGTTTRFLSAATPGYCLLDLQDNKFKIEMLGYAGAVSSQYGFIKQEFAHEFCHSIAGILPRIYSDYPNGIIKNGIFCENLIGKIKETNVTTGELVGRGLYGKMFNETMMDIITMMAINTFDTPKGPTVDDILCTKYDLWNGTNTGYSIFTSITRLAIAAFSNNGAVNYQNVINHGGGIFEIRTRMNNGELYRANDFLYGILFDPLHIEEEFDKFMGNGAYKIFCEYLDQLFDSSIQGQKIPSDAVKAIMNVLPDFLNRKMAYYLKNGIITQNDANRIISNFNQIWNQMQGEYKAFFSNSDIAEIYNRAGRLFIC